MAHCFVTARRRAGPHPPRHHHHFGYEDYEAALEAARTGGAGKVVLEWSTSCVSRS